MFFKYIELIQIFFILFFTLWVSRKCIKKKKKMHLLFRSQTHLGVRYLGVNTVGINTLGIQNYLEFRSHFGSHF